MSRHTRWILGVGLLLLLTVQARSQDDPVIVKALHILEPPSPAPLSDQERFHQYLMTSIGPFPDLGEAASAGVSQWMNSPREWGQGGAGFGRRFANNVAYNVVRNSITYGLSYPTHEDTRYFSSGKTTTKARIVHALLSPVTARKPDGSDAFSYSNTAGIVGANLIALSWAPGSWRTPGSVVQGMAWSYGGTAALNVVREFVPDLIRHFRR
jgi:hypothetical protein